MKKILILLLTIFLSGCGIDSAKTNQEYNRYLSLLNTDSTCVATYDYHIEVEFERLTTKEYIYQVVVDEPKEELKNIKVVISHDAKTNDIFPSLGFFDGNYNLSNEKTDTTIKGINLVGYIPIDYNVSEPINLKVLVIYEKDRVIESCHIFSLERK